MTKQITSERAVARALIGCAEALRKEVANHPMLSVRALWLSAKAAQLDYAANEFSRVREESLAEVGKA